MKPVNRNLANEFHEESRDGVDAVFERMWQVCGAKWGGFHEAFDVSPNTIKTWRRRGAVSVKFLQGFADKYGTTLDYLMHGDRSESALVLDDIERDLIRRFRAAPASLRDAALRVLLSGEAGSTIQHVTGNRGQVTQSGKIVNKGKAGRGDSEQ